MFSKIIKIFEISKECILSFLRFFLSLMSVLGPFMFKLISYKEKTNCQDTVVLGKNVRRSFGRAQDRIPAPTRAIYEKSNELETTQNAGP